MCQKHLNYLVLASWYLQVYTYTFHCRIPVISSWQHIICKPHMNLSLDLNTSVPLSTLLFVAILHRATFSNKAINLCHYYYQCIYYSLSPKAACVMWPQFLGKYHSPQTHQWDLISEKLLYNLECLPGHLQYVGDLQWTGEGSSYSIFHEGERRSQGQTAPKQRLLWWVTQHRQHLGSILYNKIAALIFSLILKPCYPWSSCTLNSQSHLAV